MREHVRCLTCRGWLWDFTNPMTGVAWERCFCGTRPIPRQLPTDVAPDKARCRGCGGPVGAGRMKFCSARCLEWQGRKEARDRKHDYPERGPRNTRVPKREALPAKWG